MFSSLHVLSVWAQSGSPSSVCACRMKVCNAQYLLAPSQHSLKPGQPQEPLVQHLVV